MDRLLTRSRMALLLFFAGTAGCTHLETRPSADVPSVRPGAAASQGAQRGLSYALPMLQYELKFTYRLTNCSNDAGEPEFAITAESANRYVAGERFEVDYEALTSIMKTTSFAVTFHEAGTLRSINVSARDRSGAVLADLARIGVSVASIASGGPVGMVGESPAWVDGNPRPGLTCNAETAGILAVRVAAAAEVKRLTPLVTDRTEEVTRLTTLATAQAALPEDRVRYRTALDALLLHQRDLRTAQAEVARADGKLSVSMQRSWPDEAGGIKATAGTIDLDQENLVKLAGWFMVPNLEEGRLVPATANPTVHCMRQDVPALDCLHRLTRLNIALAPATTQQFAAVAADASASDDVISPADRAWARGVFIREPIQARLLICRAADQRGSAGAAEEPPCFANLTYRGDLVTAPQFGRLRLLAFTNAPFEEGELKLSLRADGVIESFSYGEESAAAGAASSLATVAERIDTRLEAMETERRSDIQYARDTRTYERNEAIAVRTEAAAVRADELAQLTHERDLLVRRREVILAQSGLTAAQIEMLTTSINAELAQLNARIAVLRATNDLTALQAAQAGR